MARRLFGNNTLLGTNNGNNNGRIDVGVGNATALMDDNYINGSGSGTGNGKIVTDRAVRPPIRTMIGNTILGNNSLADNGVSGAGNGSSTTASADLENNYIKGNNSGSNNGTVLVGLGNSSATMLNNSIIGDNSGKRATVKSRQAPARPPPR